MRIREAGIADMPAVLEIYNASILTTTTWSDEPQTLPERLRWLDDRHAQDDAVLVADDDGATAGFAAYGEFRDNTLWPGYRLTVENTVHILDTYQRRGVGRSLMEQLIEHATQHGKHTMIAAVDSENTASISFHQALGFAEVGRLPEIGWKFDRWLDLVLLQRQLS